MPLLLAVGICFAAGKSWGSCGSYDKLIKEALREQLSLASKGLGTHGLRTRIHGTDGHAVDAFSIDGHGTDGFEANPWQPTCSGPDCSRRSQPMDLPHGVEIKFSPRHWQILTEWRHDSSRTVFRLIDREKPQIAFAGGIDVFRPPRG